nr:polysaccharide lyase family 1 protein [Treponema sp.]
MKALLRVALKGLMLACTGFFVSCGGSSGGSGSTIAEDSLTGVSISGSDSVRTEKTLTLTAVPVTTGSPDVTYTWALTDTNSTGSSLSAESGKTITFTAGETAGSVTVKVTATWEEATVTATKTITVTAVSASETDITVTPGESITTYGWADMANESAGMSYPDTDNIIYIGDDGYKVGSGELTAYTSSLTKRMVFTNAIASGSVSSSSVNTTAAIIVVSGTVDLGDGVISDSDHSYYDEFDSSTYARLHDDITYEIGSNKAIIGVNSAKLAYGGLYAKATSSKPAENIIIQNVIFWDAHGSTEQDTTYNSKSKASIDNLVFEATFSSYKATYLPHNIWIDHCVFTDGTCSDLTRNYHHDGSLDVKAAQYMTVSYCEFTNHDKVTLLAPNENYTKAEDRQITFHHNYYHDAIQRMPRSRGCQVHIYNNYYDSIGTSGNGGYTLGPGINSQYIVENNYFGSWYTSSCLVKYFDGSASSDDTLSKFYQSGNNVTISNSNVSY